MGSQILRSACSDCRMMGLPCMGRNQLDLVVVGSKCIINHDMLDFCSFNPMSFFCKHLFRIELSSPWLSSMEFSSPPGKEKSKSSSSGLVIGLDDNIGEFLHVQDSCEWNLPDGDDINDVEEGIEDLKISETKPGQKSLCKSNTFPSPGKVLLSAGSDEDGEELETALQQMFSDEPVCSPHRSVSLPTPLKLVSAVKGSREKLGAAPRKLTVKWAPDVYDPPPTIMSHTVSRSKKQQKLKKEGRNNRQKNGKKWQKGNSSRGSSGSKNKQFRKNAGYTEKGYSSLDPHDRVVELSDDLHQFDVGGPDSYCGSSFLKESLTKVHYSVAEAL